MSNMAKDIGKWIKEKCGDIRYDEYKQAYRFLDGCQNILDVACGSGTFMRRYPERCIGIDINPENIEYCVANGLNARVGNALSLQFDDNSFDGVHCSHLLQVFHSPEAVQLIRELGRVAKPGAVVVLTALNSFKRFFRHPENARPYPPDAITRLFGSRSGATSPMYTGLPQLQFETIWLRRTPLFEFYSSTNPKLMGYCSGLNILQYRLLLRKYWAYDAYVMKLRSVKN